MITLKKSDSKDFVILNITDMQMNPSDWNEGDKAGQSVVHTISTLVDRVKPDLITVTGDIANGYAEFEDGDPYNSIWNSVYRNFTDFMDSFRIPWAPVILRLISMGVRCFLWEAMAKSKRSDTNM